MEKGRGEGQGANIGQYVSLRKGGLRIKTVVSVGYAWILNL